MPRVLGFLASGLLFLAPSVPLVGQQATPQEDIPDIFGEVIDVRVVNLEVVVTDRDGNRVLGLGPEDFRLFVDGVETPIDYFSEIVGGEGVDRPRDADTSALPGVEPGEAVGTNYLVYVDDNHTVKRRRDLIVRGLIDDLAGLGPEDRMAIVVHSGTRLHMLSSWSRSQRDLERALARLLDGREFGGSLRSGLRTARLASLQERHTTADVRDDRPRGFGGATSFTSFDRATTGFSSASFFGNSERRIDLEHAISGVVSTLRSFAQPEGRRVMLLVGGDLPLGVFSQDEESLVAITDLEIQRSLVETANLLGYTIYPVDASGGNDLLRHANLNHLAASTGGRPLYQRAVVLADVVQDTRSYYWLGFTPTMEHDDARHDIEIEVLRPGLRVRTRSNYIDLSRAAQLSMMAQSALLFGDAIPSKTLKVELGLPTRWGLRKMNVPVTLWIPLDEIEMLPRGEGSAARLELRFAVVDATGSQANIPIVPITLTGEYEPGDVYRYETSLHMRRRPHQLLVSVHDPLGGTTLNGRADFSFRGLRQAAVED